MDTGAISWPGALQGAIAAEKYINNQLGGIHGHPIKLVSCDMMNTVQATQACGLKFASDPTMSFATTTLNVFGSAGLISAMAAAHKVILGGIGITPSDLQASNTYWIWPSSEAINDSILNVAKNLPKSGIHNYSVLYIQGDSAAQQSLKETQAGLAGSGVTLTSSAVSASAADYLAALAAAKATTGEALQLSVPTPTACSAIAKDLQTLNIKPKIVISEVPCVPPSTLAANPGMFPNWYFDGDQEDALDAPANLTPPDVAELDTNWTKYINSGPPAAEAAFGWGVVLAAYKILSQANYTTLTPSVVRQAIAAYKGPVPMSTAHLACPGPAPTPALCNTTAIWYHNDNGHFALGGPPGAS